MLGGAVNFYLVDPATERPLKWWQHIVIGVSAALLVPVFLNMISSNLIAEIRGSMDAEGTLSKLLVLSGFCLLAAISSRTFIHSMTDRLLQQLNETKKAMTDATQQVEAKMARVGALEDSVSGMQGDVQEAKLLANIAQDAPKLAAPEPHPSRGPEGATSETNRGPTPGQAADDPWKGVFGGKSVNKAKGRELTARVLPLPSQDGWCSIELTVRALPGAAPLAAPVQFFVHETFPNNRPVVTPRNGVATLFLKSWGAFTVGALTDDGACELELDLAELADAPAEFRGR